MKNTFFEMLYFMVLYAAIAFETTILGYQFLANPEPCIFCLGIFSSLLLIAFFSHMKNFIVILTVILAIYIALNTLAISKNKAYITTPGNYLIQLKTCPHCIKVKTYFKDNNIRYTPISAREVNARKFLKFVDINSIPILIIKGRSGITLLKGDKDIITHFEAKKEPKNIVEISQDKILPPIQSASINLSSDFLSAGGDTGDCALTIVEEVACEQNKTKPTPDN